MKAYTNLEQSKELAKILPSKSADLCFQQVFEQHKTSYYKIEMIPYRFYSGISIPSWSLVALLGVIPKRIKEYNVLRIDISEDDFAIWYDEIGYGVNNDLPNITTESPIDACYEMIIHLHEQKLL